jgi:AcrR family transcriptional regulator
MSDLTRKEREKADHRRAILEAAEAVFAQKGYHAATVQEIAERAEFSVGYLYSLFEHKMGLYVELVEMRASEFMADVEERLRHEKDCLGKVRAAIAAKVDFFTRHQQFFLIFSPLRAEDGAEGPPLLPEATHRRYREYIAGLSEVFEEGTRAGLFVHVDPQVLVLCMEGLTNAAIAHWVASGGEAGGMPAPEVLEQVFFQGILADRGE